MVYTSMNRSLSAQSLWMTEGRLCYVWKWMQKRKKDQNLCAKLLFLYVEQRNRKTKLDYGNKLAVVHPTSSKKITICTTWIKTILRLQEIKPKVNSSWCYRHFPKCPKMYIDLFVVVVTSIFFSIEHRCN